MLEMPTKGVLLMQAMDIAWMILKRDDEDFPADLALSPRPVDGVGAETSEEEDYDPVTGRNQAGVTASMDNFQALNELCGDMTDEQCQAMFDNLMMFRGAESDLQGDDE